MLFKLDLFIIGIKILRFDGDFIFIIKLNIIKSKFILFIKFYFIIVMCNF